MSDRKLQQAACLELLDKIERILDSIKVLMETERMVIRSGREDLPTVGVSMATALRPTIEKAVEKALPLADQYAQEAQKFLRESGT